MIDFYYVQIVQRNLGANNRFIKDFPLFRNTVHIAASFDRHEICDMLLQFSKVSICDYYILCRFYINMFIRKTCTSSIKWVLARL
jgi:hypothetical protein